MVTPFERHAPIFLNSLAIGDQRLDIGSNDRGDRSSLSLPDDLARGCLALAQRSLEPFNRHGQADLVAIPEAIGDRLGDAKNLYGHPFDGVGFDAFRKEAIREAHETNWRPIAFGSPILLADGNPHLPWELDGKLMEREG